MTLEDFPTVGRTLLVTVLVQNEHVLAPCVVSFAGPLGLAVTAWPFRSTSANQWTSACTSIYPVVRGRPEDAGTPAGFHQWVWPREVVGKDGKIGG